MCARVKWTLTLAAVVLAAWWFLSTPLTTPITKAPPLPEIRAVREPPVVARPPLDAPAPAAASGSYPAESRPLARLPPEPPSNLQSLNERTLIGTRWERDGFGVEFGPGGKLLIGGRERAKWRVEGQRVRLYRDTTGEEHWLDIVGAKLMWEGREFGRTP